MVHALTRAKTWLPAAALVVIAWVSLACGGQAQQVDAPDPVALLIETAANLRAIQSAEFQLTHETGSLYVPAYSAKITDISGSWDATAGAVFAIDAYLVNGPEIEVQSGSYVQVQAVATPEGYFSTEPISGLWLKQPAAAAPIEVSKLQHLVADLVAAVADPVLVGEEAVDNAAAYRISGGAPASRVAWLPVEPGEGQTLRVELWTDAAQRLPSRIDISGAIGEFDAPDTLRTITLSGFGEPTDIAPPEQFIDLSGG